MITFPFLGWKKNNSTFVENQQFHSWIQNHTFLNTELVQKRKWKIISVSLYKRLYTVYRVITFFKLVHSSKNSYLFSQYHSFEFHFSFSKKDKNLSYESINLNFTWIFRGCYKYLVEIKKNNRNENICKYKFRYKRVIFYLRIITKLCS